MSAFECSINIAYHIVSYVKKEKWRSDGFWRDRTMEVGRRLYGRPNIAISTPCSICWAKVLIPASEMTYVLMWYLIFVSVPIDLPLHLPPWLSGLAISGRGAVKAWLAIRQGVGSCLGLSAGGSWRHVDRLLTVNRRPWWKRNERNDLPLLRFDAVGWVTVVCKNLYESVDCLVSVQWHL